MRIFRGGWLAAGLTLAAATLHPAGLDGPMIREVRDLVYSTPGSASLRLDLAAPAGTGGPFPAVVVFYGGAWRTGNKRANRPVLAEFARRGFVAVSPQYRHCPADRFPAQVHDAKAAVRWLRSHAAEYRVDPDRIGAMGYSAGAHLALMLGTTGPADGLEGDERPDAPSSRVSAVVNYFGPTDLAATDISPASKFLVRDFLGKDAGDDPKLAALASPLAHLDRDDAPTLSFHGTEDAVVPVTQAVRLSAAMGRSGVAGRTELLSGLGHGWAGPPMARTMEATYEFFEIQLKPAQAGPTTANRRRSG